MFEKISRVGAAAIVGVGLVVGITDRAVGPSFRADVRLTTTVLAMGGLGYETIETDLIKRVLGGHYANEEKLVGLPWPGQLKPFKGTLTLNESVSAGLVTMDEAIRSTPGPKIAAGASGSTLVVDEEMRRLANDPTAPPADELSFVVLGDPNRGILKQFRGVKVPILDYTVPEIPVTKYDVTVVTGEYDGLGDWPDRPWNLLADFNALAGAGFLQDIVPKEIVDALALRAFGSVHFDAMFADPSQVPKENVTTLVNAAGGVTTTYVVPTADLPMLRPLKALGVPQGTIDSLEGVLRPVVDSAYARNDPAWLKPINQLAAPAATVATNGTRAPKRASETPGKPTVVAAAAAVGEADGTPAPTISTSYKKPDDRSQLHRPRRGPGRQG